MLDNNTTKTKENPAPCPHCGKNDNLEVAFKHSYGHGDSGYEMLHIRCNNKDCKEGYDYGMPSNADIDRAWKIWNKRV